MALLNNAEQPIIEEQTIAVEGFTVTNRRPQHPLLLAVGFGGLQGIFALQFANGTTYLASLGLSKPLIALVWLTGPISGAFFQPYFNLCSDRCLSQWGKRRPFIIGGTVVMVCSLLMLAWLNDLVSNVAYFTGMNEHVAPNAQATGAVAVLFMFILNIAVQPVQGGLRALIFDLCPREQLDAANAWVARIISIASVLSYIWSYIDLPYWFPFLGKTQFQVLSVITSVVLCLCMFVTCTAAAETPRFSRMDTAGDMDGLCHRLRYLFAGFWRLHYQVQHVCMIQFFAWMGWFPFLFYITAYVGCKYSDISTTAQKVDFAARAGSAGMLIFAVVSLFASITIPMLLRPKDHDGIPSHRYGSLSPAAKYLQFMSGMTDDIRHLWMTSHILFAVCMLATIVVKSASGTYILIGAAGISWAVTVWAPFAIISKAILNESDLGRKEWYDSPVSTGDNHERQPGTVIGLHNVAITVPQILSALLCSFVYWTAERFKLATFEDSIGLVLRIGGAFALVAACLTYKLSSDDCDDDRGDDDLDSAAQEPLYSKLTDADHA